MASLNEERKLLSDLVAKVPGAELSKAEEAQLLVAYVLQRDTEAGRKLVSHNLRFVGKVAFSVLRPGISSVEIYNEGVLGLEKALNKFSLSGGHPFRTFAYLYIKGQMLAFMRNNRDIRLPRSALDKLTANLDRVNRILNEGGVGGIDTPNDMMDIDHELIAVSQAPVSIFTAVGDQDSGVSTLGDLIVDDASPTPEESMLIKQEQDTYSHLIEGALSVLPETDREFLCRTKGLGQHEEVSLAKLAEEKGVTRQAVSVRCQKIEKRFTVAVCAVGALKDYDPVIQDIYMEHAGISCSKKSINMLARDYEMPADYICEILETAEVAIEEFRETMTERMAAGIHPATFG